ncbi:MAG: hypothetical protein ACW99E_18300 [Promethearchaeota archaeon]
MKFSRIKLGRQGNFILGIFMIYFLFFGYIANTLTRSVGEELILLFQILIDPQTFWAFLILFIIMFFVALRESFFEYAIRNSIWYIPAIIMMSWFWYWFLFGFDVQVFYIYFIRIEGYLTILSLLGTNLLAAILASIINEKRKLAREMEKLSLQG